MRTCVWSDYDKSRNYYVRLLFSDKNKSLMHNFEIKI